MENNEFSRVTDCLRRLRQALRKEEGGRMKEDSEKSPVLIPPSSFRLPPSGAEALLGELEAALDDLRRGEDERSEAELRVQAHCLRYRELFEFAPEAYLVTDRAGVIQEANQTAADLLQTRKEFLAGQLLPFFVVAEDRFEFYSRLNGLARGVATQGWHVRLRPRRSDLVDVALTATAVAGPEGQPCGFRWLLRDITGWQQAERRLREQQRLAESLVETAQWAQQQLLQSERLAAIGQMVAGLAHESRNALQRAQACLERLRWKLQDQPAALDLVDRARRAQDDLVRLFEDVRAYAGPVHLTVERVDDLREVWREAWEQVTAPHQQSRDARLAEEPATLDLRCEADRFRLGQVFRNLFENSLAACPDPVRVTVRCSETDLAGRAALRVQVRDNGPGLDEEQQRHLFEPFYTTKVKGCGLGLAIARRLVEAHGGHIAVTAAGGPGAEIVVTLPRAGP